MDAKTIIGLTLIATGVMVINFAVRAHVQFFNAIRKYLEIRAKKK